MKKILVLIYLILLSIFPGRSFQEQKNNSNEISSIQYIQEPVFNGKVYISVPESKFKTTVLLIHGVGNDASDIWKGLLPVLEKQYRVIYFDLPGFGRSDKKDALYSPQNYAVFIKWICDKYVKGPLYVIGHSLGGAISLCFAGIYPDKLQRLVLVDAAGILHRTAYTKSISTSRVPEANKLNILPDQVELLSRTLENQLLSEMQQFLPKDFSVIYDNSILKKKFLDNPQKVASLSLIYSDFSEQVKNIKIPVFIIWGGSDPVAPLRTGKMLAWKAQHTSLNTMPGLGHNPMIDCPSEFNNLILKCLLKFDKTQQFFSARKPFVASNKTITFDNKEGITIEGDYKNIIINNCRNVLVKNVSAEGITIGNSWIEIENIIIKSEKTAFKAVDSMVTVTGGHFEGDTGLSVSNSKIDLAGVEIEAKNKAVCSDSDSSSTVVFSICEIKSRITDRTVHDIIEITKYYAL